ncbi:hypothetical protein DOY81_012554, partial [Sarcophaga bullata]
MDCFEQLNKLFPNEQHNTIINSQICTLDCRNSTAVKEETKLPFFLSRKEAGKKSSGLSAPETKQQHSKDNKNCVIKTTKVVKSTTTNSQRKNLPKMSDWGDDDTEAIDGKGFGNVFYKPPIDDVYQNDNGEGYGDYNDDANGNGNDYENNRRYQGGGGGRGRNGGRGRSGGFNRFNTNNDNNENGESNAQEYTISQDEENYQNFVFALTPKNFSKESLKDFLKNMKNLFRQASLVQKYTLMRYLIEAYENVLENTQQTESNKKNIRTKKKPEQQLQTSLGDAVPIVRTIDIPADYEIGPETFPDLPISFGVSSMSSPSNNTEVVDVLNIYQAESELNKLDNASTDNNITQLESVLPFYQAPAMNISNLFESMEPEQDLHVSPIRPNQASPLHQEKTPDITRRQSERLQAKEFQMSACVRQTSGNSTPRRSRYNLRPQKTVTPLPYLGETPPLTPTRPKPRTYISEEEYSLRFRLPRKKFLEITELPHFKCGIETSALLDAPMDTSLIEEEYLCADPGDHVTTDNMLTHPASITAMTTTADQYSSLNAVRQAPSSMQELSSFGRPLQATQIQELSRLENERRLNKNAVNQDMPSITENVNADNIANISTESIPAMGMTGESLHQLQPQEQDPNQIHNEQLIVMESIKMPQLPTEFTTDSGIQFPAAAAATADSGLKQPPLYSVIDSTKAGQQAKLPQTQITPTDSGVFKTPMIPPELPLKTATITTLPSIEVHDFESNLISRTTLNTSTPLGVTKTEDMLQLLKHRKTLLLQKENEISNVTDVSGGSAIIEDNQQTKVAVQTTQYDQLTLQPIVEVGEDVIRPSESLTTAHPNGDNVAKQNAATLVMELPSQQTTAETENEDYRKDWYEILRTRLQNSNNYANCTTPKHKRKFKRPQRIKSLHAELQAVNLKETVTGPAATSDLLQQTLAGILPSLTTSADGPRTANLNNSTDMLYQAGDNFPSPVISPQQQQYDEFIFNNVENITKIVNNLDSCRLMLENYRRSIEKKLKSPDTNGFKQPCQHYNPEVLLNAPEERLAIKLNLVQNIIRQVSFDFTKCEFIKDRMSAAIGFAFLLELKSAGIINLSSDGRYNSERRNGFGGGRGRNGGGRGGGGFRDGGRRDYNGNRGGGGDYNQQNNGGGYGGGGGGNNDDGEEQKKPREFYIPPEPTDNEDEIFGSGITSGINFSKYDSIPVKVM